MNNEVVTIFGGSGFIGRQLVRSLASKGALIKIAVRNPNRAKFLQPLGDVGQITFIKVNILNETLVDKIIEESDHVINLVGTFSSRGKENFNTIHVNSPKYISEACGRYGVKNLIHVTSLGVDKKSPSVYLKTKAYGEEQVKNNFPNTIIHRPSLIFGPQDNFFNLFASLAQFSPFMPVFGESIFSYGKVLYQPVYVQDVASGIINSMSNIKFKGKTFEIGGPSVYSFQQLIEMILDYSGQKRFLLPFPFIFADILATLTEFSPIKLVTRDQVRQLKINNIVNSEALTLDDLGIIPTPAESVVPNYLDKFKREKRLRRI